MTVNEHSFSFLIKSLKCLADDKYFRYFGNCQVTPVEVEIGNAGIVEDVCVVREPELVIDAVSTQ